MGDRRSHVVRNNRISFCEQTGVVAVSAARSARSRTTRFTIAMCCGSSRAEMAASSSWCDDVEISHNHIYRNGSFAVWLDWMAQGRHVTGNLMHDNLGQDLFMEVDHGPFVVDNNLMLSRNSQLIVSRGGASPQPDRRYAALGGFRRAPDAVHKATRPRLPV